MRRQAFRVDMGLLSSSRGALPGAVGVRAGLQELQQIQIREADKGRIT